MHNHMLLKLRSRNYLLSFVMTTEPLPIENNPATAGGNANEALLVGILMAAMIAALEIGLSRLPMLLNPSGESFALTLEVPNFIVNPCLIFAIFYFWSRRRLIAQFRSKYRRIIVLLFVGSTIGYGVYYFVLLFVLGANAAFPTFASFVFWMFSVLLSIIGAGLSLAFVGFTVVALAHLRNSSS